MIEVNNNNSVNQAVAEANGAANLPNHASLINWSKMNETEHFVQFYETDKFLMSTLCDFIDAGLESGETCIVIATKDHRKDLDQRLLNSGKDVAAIRTSGQFISLDAEETLAKFMVGETPEPVNFTKLMEGILTRAVLNGRRVRIFGEMVALLWANKNHNGAIRLEEFWNILSKNNSFQLFCAYPLGDFSGQEFSEPFGHVCKNHSRVIPGESYTALADEDERLRTISLLQQRAESLENEIVERKKVEESLRKVKEELELQATEREVLLNREQIARLEAENANRLKDEFLATVSHELRTPLNAIIGWSNILQKETDEETRIHAVETIKRNALSQAQLIEDLLDISRVITGKLQLNIEKVDVVMIINTAIDSIRLAADSKDIQLNVKFDSAINHIFGDANRLQQIVWNLLSNAIKFTPTGGRVEVKIEQSDSALQIIVSDTGQGIGIDFLPFIFDRFRQGDGSTTRRNGGLGLGLAIVRQLVELHGGTVSVDSRGENHGTTFIIKLPTLNLYESLTKAPSKIQAKWSLEKNNGQTDYLSSLEGVKILLVDDNEDTLEMLALILTEYKTEIQTAASVSEAFEILEWFEPNVLISDLAMPDEDGYSLIGRVRTSGNQIPAIALTAYVRAEDRKHALLAGFNMFVPKPIEPAELTTVIASLIKQN